jgi:hypothetical protein
LASPSTVAIDLFQPPNFRTTEVLVVLGGSLGTAAALVRVPSDRVGLPEAVLLVAWLWASCVARRHIEFLSIVWIVIAGRLAEDYLQRRAPSRPRMLSIGAGAAVATAGVLMVLAAFSPKDPLWQVPASAAGIVVERRLRENVLNIYHWGGYLDYAWAGHPRVFIDGRNQLFDNGVFEDHGKIARLEPGWPEILDVYEINTVLWESGALLDLALRQQREWREVFRDRIAVVYVREGL